MKTLTLTILFSSAFLLTGCLVPEKFVTKIDISSDASYRVMFSGTVAHALAVAQIVTTKKALSPKEETAMVREAQKMSQEIGVKKSAYIQNGRFEIDLEQSHKSGESTDLFKIIKVISDKDGVMTLSTQKLIEKDRAGIAQLGLVIDGTLEVSLPKNAQIISSNATSVPTFFGLLGVYSWKINSIDVQPMMKIKLKI